jgi:hypothetical protein
MSCKCNKKCCMDSRGGVLLVCGTIMSLVMIVLVTAFSVNFRNYNKLKILYKKNISDVCGTVSTKNGCENICQNNCYWCDIETKCHSKDYDDCYINYIPKTIYNNEKCELPNASPKIPLFITISFIPLLLLYFCIEGCILNHYYKECVMVNNTCKQYKCCRKICVYENNVSLYDSYYV